MDSARILIGGDVCPINSYEALFRQGSQDEILGPFVALARRADLFVANLECPLIGEPSPISKTGPVLGAPQAVARGLKAMGLHAVGLANNHIMDHGARGLASTLEACRSQRIATFGAGAGLEAASGPAILEVRGLRIGLMAMAEREWSIATRGGPGANPLDLIDFVRRMRSFRASIDCLVVLLHAGSELYALPSPRLRKVCQFLVEEGAHVVTCQHSHCAGSWELYQGRPIVYGQGNFIFDYPAQGRHGREGTLISLEFREGGEIGCELVPFTQGGDRPGLRAFAPEAEASFLEALTARSRELESDERLEARWEAYCQSRKLALLDEVLGHGRIFRRLNRHGALLDLRGKPYLKNLLSIVQNESFVETLDTVLRTALR
jgi:poly-gamma-glutamate synthesis protein (capsule biosynthesis protein)